MTNPQLVFKILGLGSCALAATVTGPVQAMPSFGDCAKQIERRGYQIDDMDRRGRGYEVDTLKEGRRFDLWLDNNCMVLDKRPD